MNGDPALSITGSARPRRGPDTPGGGSSAPACRARLNPRSRHPSGAARHAARAHRDTPDAPPRPSAQSASQQHSSTITPHRIDRLPPAGTFGFQTPLQGPRAQRQLPRCHRQRQAVIGQMRGYDLPELIHAPWHGGQRRDHFGCVLLQDRRKPGIGIRQRQRQIRFRNGHRGAADSEVDPARAETVGQLAVAGRRGA